MGQSFTKEFKNGIGGFNPSPGFSQRVSVVNVGYPVTPGTSFSPSSDFTDLPNGVDTGALGEIHLTIDFGFENYITNSSDLNINNNVNVTTEIIAGIPQPCLLDADGNGYVSQGDIDKIFTQYVGMSTSEVVDIAGPGIASTLDLDGDGLVTWDDYILALEYTGTVGCVEQPDLSSYPMYLDENPDDVAFAYSLRKLRSTYDGPCMSVFLDIDRRCFGDGVNTFFFKSLSNLGPNFTDTPDTLPDDFYVKVGDYRFFGNPSPIVVADQVYFNVSDAWNDFLDAYPWLKEPLDIPFGPDGYIDYSLISLLMADPVAAYGIEMTDVQKNAFMSYYSEVSFSGLTDFGFVRTFKEKAVVLIDRWFDQREDEQRDLVATVNKVNEWGFHPFSKTSLIVGRFGKVMQKNGGMVIGSGTLSGLGDRAHDLHGVTEMLVGDSDLDGGNIGHGCSIIDPSIVDSSGLGPGGIQLAYPGTYAYPNGEDVSNSPIPYNTGSSAQIERRWPTNYIVKQYYNYGSETPLSWQGGQTQDWVGDTPSRFKKMQYQVGVAYLRQETTNAQYMNPYYESNATLWNTTYYGEQSLAGTPVGGLDGAQPAVGEGQNGGVYYTGSNGERSTFMTAMNSSGGAAAFGLGATGSHNGIGKALNYITDNPTPGFAEYYDTGSNPYLQNGIYRYVENSYYSSYYEGAAHPEGTTNVFGNNENLVSNPFISSFKIDKFKDFAHEGHYTNYAYVVREYKVVPDINNNLKAIPSATSSYDHRMFFNIGNYRGFDIGKTASDTGSGNYSIGGGPNEGPDVGQADTFNWTSDATENNPDVHGNLMEFVSWRDALPLQSGVDYLEESKAYFENKKIVL
jgi:hypothetical protein